MDEYILKISDLSLCYEETRVVKDLSLNVRKGDVLCIVGESGSGKSTLLRAISGNPLVKIESGKIIYKDQEIFGEQSKRSRKILGCSMGLVQQNPSGAFNPIRKLKPQFEETCKSNSMKYDQEKIRAIFGTLGLKDADKILNSRPYELSGGMNQRIAIAASLMLDPELLLCDEITSALDVTTAIALTDELVRLKKELDVTIILVTHNLGIAANIADRIAIMYQGTIVERGETAAILSTPEHEYTKRLLQDVPKLRTV